MKEDRYGARAFHLYFPPPKLRLYSPPIQEEWIRQLDIEKLHYLIQKRYLVSGKGCTKVMITCHSFHKTLTDIIVVCNRTGNGVNTPIYAPSLFIPTADTLYRHIEVDMEQENFDVIKEFHNYVLAKE